MSSETSSVSQTQSQKAVVIPEGEYAKYLANLAGEMAEEKAKKRETAWHSGIAIVFGALAFLGYSNLSSMKGELREIIEFQIGNHLPEAVEKYVSGNRSQILGSSLGQLQLETDSKLALYQLALLTKDLANPERNSFTDEERDLANALVKEVVKTPALVEKPQFVKALADLAKAFLLADLTQYLDELDDTVGQVGLKSHDFVNVMSTHYGMRVVGSAEVPPDLLKRFEKYLNAAEKYKDPERAIMWRALYAYKKEGGPNFATQKLLQDASFLGDKDLQAFLERLKAMSMLQPVTGTTARISELATKLTKAYSKDLKSMEQKVLISNKTIREIMSGLADN